MAPAEYTTFQNGYAWQFCTATTSLFRFRKTRSGSVPKEVFGDHPLPGVLVVDRYQGYNKAPCPIQHCYAPLLREVRELDKEFPDDPEIDSFVKTFAPLLSQAMSLRGVPISHRQFYRRVKATQQAMVEAVERSAPASGGHPTHP